MSLGESVRSGIKWMLLGNTGNHILEFLFGVALARLLTPADFGLIITIQIFTGFIGMLTNGGMGQALIRAKRADEEDFNAVFTLQLGIGILIYLAFFLAAPWIAEFFDQPIIRDLMRVSTLIFLIRPFAYLRISWLNREMLFKRRAAVMIVTSLATGITGVSMALAGMGVWSLTLSGIFGAFARNLALYRLTPLRLHLNFDTSVMRRHSGYGFKIVTNDLLSHIKQEATNLIMSKVAGPAFLGLYNKAASLNQIPFTMLGSPVSQTVFRAMSKIQDDLDQTKYMFYRVVTLLMVYVLPCYVGLWWLAEPFVLVVYGEQWVAAAAPLRILAAAGFLFIIGYPCGVVLMAQNRLTQEMIAQFANLIVTVTACLIGIRWGLEGVAWAMLLSLVFGTVYFFVLVFQTIPTRVADLVRALIPGLGLNGLLFLSLALLHTLVGGLEDTHPAGYILAMILPGALVYTLAFLYLPIAALEKESARWRNKIGSGIRLVYSSRG